MSVNCLIIPYTLNNWRVKYLANRSKIVVGVILIWRKTVAVSKCNSYRPETALFKFWRIKDNSPNRQSKHTANYSAYTVFCAKNQINITFYDDVLCHQHST